MFCETYTLFRASLRVFYATYTMFYETYTMFCAGSHRFAHLYECFTQVYAVSRDYILSFYCKNSFCGYVAGCAATAVPRRRISDKLLRLRLALRRKN